MASTGKKDKSRDAERSREAILRVAEELFTERGFEGVGLGEIAAAAGLSRGAPNYFFGSKERLYEEVLERVFADRDVATRRACAPLLRWAESGSREHIRRPLTQAVEGYLEFLLGRPAFLRLLQREELAGGRRLRAVPREAVAIEEAFKAIRSVGPQRGLRAFDVRDAVFLFVAMTFFPLAHRETFMPALGRDVANRAVRRRQIRLAVDQLLHLLGAGPA